MAIKTNNNKSKRSKTRYGRDYEVILLDNHKITIECEDGTLIMPNYMLKFIRLGRYDARFKNTFDNYIIVKEDDRDLYYEIKDNIKNYKTFYSRKIRI